MGCIFLVLNFILFFINFFLLSVERWCLCVTLFKGFVWFINCESWLFMKNFMMVFVIILELIKLWGMSELKVLFMVVSLFLMVFCIFIKFECNLLVNNFFIVLILWFFKWFLLLILFWLFLIFMRYLMVVIIFLCVKVVM